GQQRDAVKSTLRRLCGRGSAGYFLKSEPLDARRVYYRLTTRATNLLGIADDVARPLGIQARIRRYAILWLMCIDDSAVRNPFNLRQFPEHFSVVADRLPRSHFYIEELPGDKTQLGFAVVDTGRHRQRVFRNTFTTMKRFLERGWLDDFIAARCFELSVLTLTDTARDAIDLQLGKYLHRTLAEPLLRLGVGQDAPLPFTIRVHVVPGLLEVIPDGICQRMTR
ncbi:MAG: hypothetical protein GXY58_03985, partial [Planctomycetaceae bacterium]|nr:hypothetical protein [Planctomycetaceae bacterium]